MRTPDVQSQVLGCALTDATALATVLDEAEPPDFTGTARTVFETIRQVVAAGEVVNLVTVSDRRPDLAAEISRYTTDAMLGPLTPALRTLRQARQRRELDALLDEAADMRSAASAVDDRLAVLEDGLSAIELTGTPSYHRPAELANLLEDAYRRIAAGEVTPVPTGFATLDRMLAGGMRPGEMIVLGARASVGKTALALAIARNAAHSGAATGLFSLEMSTVDVGFRLAALSSGELLTKFRSATLTGASVDRFREFLDRVRTGGLHIAAPSKPLSMREIRAIARRMVRLDGVRFLVLDYLSLIRPIDPRRPRWEQVSELSAAVKALAEELAVPVLLLVQLNRQAEGQTPTLAQIRESGSIEQDADVVLLLHRDTRAAREATVQVAKQRNGPTGSLRLEFDPESARFHQSLATAYGPPSGWHDAPDRSRRPYAEAEDDG